MASPETAVKVAMVAEVKGKMNYPQEDHPEVNDSLKHVFDEIASELADALRNLKTIERGTTKSEAQKIADQTVRMIRRAGEQCARFGV